MGGSKKQTVGYWYNWAMAFGWCKGPVDAFLEFRGGDKTAWQGRMTESGQIVINKPNLWGGEDSTSGGSGGIVGTMDVMFGEADQAPNDYLISTFGAEQSGRRGKFCTVFRGGKFGAFVANPKPVSAKIERILKDWQDDTPWYPEKATIVMAGTGTSPAPISGYWRVEAGAQYTLRDQSAVFGTVTSAYVATADQIGQNAINARNEATGSSYVFSGSQYTTELDGDPGITAWDEAHGSDVGIAAVKATPVCPTGYDWSVGEGDDTTPELDAPVVVCTLSVGDINAMNPAHIIYDSITHADLQGEPIGMVSDASFRAAADKLYDEGFGLCPVYDSSQETPEQFQQRICDIIGASLSQSRVDGLYYLDLIRGDYDLASLPIIGEDDVIAFEQDPSVITETGNRGQAEWFDPVAKETRTTPPVFSMGNVQSAGRVIPITTKKYPEIPVESLALRVITRDVKASAVPLNRLALTTRATLRGARPGLNYRLQLPSEGIGDMVVVIGSVAHGTATNGQMKIVAVQNVYSLPSTVYVKPVPGLWTPPDTVAVASAHQVAMEAPYVELAASLSAADLDALTDDAGYLLVAADKPGDGTNYLLATAAAGEDYADHGFGDWCPTATVNEAALPLDTSFTFTGGSLISRVTVGSWALWDSEIVRVDAIDADAGTLELGRGCADTTPAGVHDAGARILFCGDWGASDQREYVGGDVVRAKLLTRLPADQLDPLVAPELSVTMDDRQVRPYPPGGLHINGEAYPAAAFGPDLEISFVPRDRLLQADQLIDTTAAGVGPEAGTTYTLRGYLGGTLVHTESAATGSPLTWTPGANGAARVEIDSVRDGLTSWQPLAADFTFAVDGDLQITGSFKNAVVGVPYSDSLPITGGLEPYTLTGGTGIISGSLDTGFALSITGTTGDRYLTLECADPATADTMTFGTSVDSDDGQTATSEQSVVVSNPSTSYNALVASYAPDDWWKLEETTGTTAAGSGSSGYNGELTGGATFADTGVSVSAPSGYAGLGRGVDFAASGVGDIRITSAITPRAAFAQPPVSSDPWTIVITVAGSAGASQYLASRVNSAAIIYQFVADTVEFFGVGYVGSDPRPGSQIPLDSSDTTTPHQLAYRYDSGVWSGFKDGVKVFSVSRTFVMQGSFDFYLGSDSGSNVSFCKTWDYQGYNRALTDTEIADMWAARDAV